MSTTRSCPRFSTLLLLLTAGLAACAAPASNPQADQQSPSQTPAVARRVIAVANRVEPVDLAGKSVQPGTITLQATKRFFNAGLVIRDDQHVSHPYLADRTPGLNTDSWQVFPDGTMQTTYHLHPGLTWHDGQPLTSDDFAFGWRVYTTPAFGVATVKPQGIIDDIQSPDGQTVVIRWKTPYPKAGALEYGDLAPLPRHLLEGSLQPDNAADFLALPFWTTQYVGAGPFRLQHWEPGAYLEAVAFDGHVGGKPKIDALKITWINDANTAVSSLLAGEVQLLVDDVIYLEQAVTIRRQMVDQGTGNMVVEPGLWRGTQVQTHPERVAPSARALADVRVRKAWRTLSISRRSWTASTTARASRRTA